MKSQRIDRAIVGLFNKALTLAGYRLAMRSYVLARADELEHGYADGAVEEGIARTEEAISRALIKDAQLWLSAIFVVVRRRRLLAKD